MPTIKGLNDIVQGDCVERMRALPAGAVDLVFADPPFNIGYEYDVYDDQQEHRDYLDWSRTWIGAVHRVLKPVGHVLAGDRRRVRGRAEVASQEIGFHCRSWVIWYYTFGVNCTNKFSRSHAHLFYFVKDPESFTFRADELENRVPSARQLVYADTRANPNGRLPDDTWVLRPQDLAELLHHRRRHLVLPARCRHVQGAGRLSRLPDARATLGRIIRLLARGRSRARPVQRQRHRPWPWPRSWAGGTWGSTCRPNISPAAAPGWMQSRPATRSTEPPSPQ